MEAHYSNAPVSEAVIDIHVAFEQEPTDGAISSFVQTLDKDFPNKQLISSVQLAVGPGLPNGGTLSPRGALGIRLAKQNDDRILQIRKSSFSYSHLPPYTNWENFVGEAAGYWGQYVDAFKPNQITRTAVRYINRIPVPLSDDLDKYLNLLPSMPEDIGDMVEGYFMQLVLPVFDVGSSCKAVINTGLEQSPDQKQMSILLDIDVVSGGSYGADNQMLFELLGSLRKVKNKIFESCITDHVRSIIR